MRLPAATVLAAALLAGGGAAACGGDDEPTAEEVVRGWSTALNAGDDERAAGYFAVGARVIQGGAARRLADREAAVRFNRSLPCSGRIVRLTREANRVTAVFVLGERPGRRCDGPGERAAAIFGVQDGEIVLWHQVPPPATPPTQSA